MSQGASVQPPCLTTQKKAPLCVVKGQHRRTLQSRDVETRLCAPFSSIRREYNRRVTEIVQESWINTAA